MKFYITTILLLTILHLSAQQPVNSNETEIVFRQVNVIPMDREEVLKNQVVVVKNGKITAMGDASAVKYAENAVIVEGEGRYLMPGLAEMHAHIPTNDDAESHKNVLMMFALHGVTTIRGMLGHPSHLALRDAVKNGEITGPRIYTSGPALSGGSVKSKEDAERLVAEQKKAGYDFLKILPGLSKENFAAAAKAAKQQRIPFAGHISADAGVWECIKARYQTIDHLDGFVEGLVPDLTSVAAENIGLFGMFIADKADQTKIPLLVKELKQNNVWIVPTQALAERWLTSARTADEIRNDPEMKYMKDKNLDNWTRSKKEMENNPNFDKEKIARYLELRRKIINDCHKAGVGILLGCDAPQVYNVPGPSTHHELQYLVDAGLSPYDALKTGTVNVAAFYKKKGEAGVVRKGAVADLLLLNANPLENISNTKNIGGVMLNGRWMSKEYIDDSLKKLEKSI